MADGITKVEEDNPWRCSATTRQGQCLNKATTLGGTCLIHGGNKAQEAAEKRSIDQYRVAKFQVRMKEFASSPKLKTLSDEVAILRMLLEEQLNQCNDASDLVLKSHLISDLVTKVEKTVKSCHSLETSLGGLMNKQDILVIATEIINVISSEVDDEIILERISDGIISIVNDYKRD